MAMTRLQSLSVQRLTSILSRSGGAASETASTSEEDDGQCPADGDAGDGTTDGGDGTTGTDDGGDGTTGTDDGTDGTDDGTDDGGDDGTCPADGGDGRVHSLTVLDLLQGLLIAMAGGAANDPYSPYTSPYSEEMNNYGGTNGGDAGGGPYGSGGGSGGL